MTVLRLEGVKKHFGAGELRVEVLHGIDLEVAAGEFVALIGPSGSGKSTLLNILGLLDRASSGAVHLMDQAVGGLDDAALTALRGESIGFIFQFHHLVGALTVLENVMMPAAALRGGFRPQMAPKARALLDAVGLGDRADAWPRELSGGMQQRVAIARALMNDPPLVLADEPTGNLDTATGDQVFDLLRRRNADEGTAFIIVTHDPRLAARCDRVLKMVDGVLVADGPPEALS